MPRAVRLLALGLLTFAVSAPGARGGPSTFSVSTRPRPFTAAAWRCADPSGLLAPGTDPPRAPRTHVFASTVDGPRDLRPASSIPVLESGTPPSPPTAA